MLTSADEDYLKSQNDLVGRLFGEELEVDGVAHGFVACVAGMEVVAGVVGCGESGGICRVLRGFVEVDEAVELVGGFDPVVDGLAHGFACGVGVSGSLIGREGCAVDLDAVLVCALGHLGETLDEVVGGDYIVWSGAGCVSDVVDALEDDEVLDACLGEDVAVEACECVGAGDVVQDAVAADAFVQDGDVGGLLVGLQAFGEDIGPAGVGAEGAVGAVGDAVSEGYDGCAVSAGEDVDAFEEGPVDDLFRVFEFYGTDDVAGSGVTGLVGEGVERDVLDGLRGDEDADGEIGSGGQLEIDGIAEGERSGGNGDGGAASEGEFAVGGGRDVAAAGAECDAGGRDGEGLGAELVGEDDADFASAERCVDDLAIGGVGGAVLAVGVGAGDG